MNKINSISKTSIGNKGETCVMDKLKTYGFKLYKRNIKHIDSEIDLVMYKYDPIKYTLNIRVIEVKTRGLYEFDMSSFKIDRKWSRIKKHFFKFKYEIDAMFDILNYSEIHFDLALVKHSQGKNLQTKNSDSGFILYSYIKDVNLLI
jgi:Holliday junction resolvase-like predicted endonuclease